MLNVQEFLNNYSIPQEGLDALHRIHGVCHKLHPTDSRVILDYDQFTSVKTNPIVRECRGLVLDSANNWEIVARGFDRFFNWGECTSDKNKFDWDNCYAGVKHDGTMLLVYRWNGRICVNTRFYWANDKMVSGYSFKELFEMAVKDARLEDFYRDNPRATLIMELVGPHNKIVRQYCNNDVSLLGVRQKPMKELTPGNVQAVARQIGVKCTEFTPINSVFDITEIIAKLPEDHEGFVAVDCQGNRWKFKSDSYIALHALKDNGNVATVKYAIPLILQNKADDIIAKFPEVANVYEEISKFLYQQIELCQDIYNGICQIENQKEFALKVKQICPNGLISSIMFIMRKTGKQPRELICEDEFKLAYKLWENK